MLSASLDSNRVEVRYFGGGIPSAFFDGSATVVAFQSICLPAGMQTRPNAVTIIATACWLYPGGRLIPSRVFRSARLDNSLAPSSRLC